MSDLDDEAPEPTCGGCYCCSGTGYFSGDELRAQAADRERQLAEARAQQDRLQVVRDDCVQNESRLLAKITELERQLAEARATLERTRLYLTCVCPESDVALPWPGNHYEDCIVREVRGIVGDENV